MGIRFENARNHYQEGIRDFNARQAFTKYTGARYTQHSVGVKNGVDGIVEFFEPFLIRNPVHNIYIVCGLEDGQYVFLPVP